MKCKERRWSRIETLISSGKIGKEVIAVQIKKFLGILCACDVGRLPGSQCGGGSAAGPGS